MEFTHEGYRKLIRLLKNHKYVVCDYDDYCDKAKTVILRHDIDTSIDKALEFARLEAEEGVDATYFVLLSTDFYNVNSAQNISKLKEMQKMGARIGLHFDETKYAAKTAEEMVSYILREKKIMETILEIPIKAVSMHRPSQWTLQQNLSITGMINSYSEEFFKNFKYVSDSRRHWREDVEAVIESDKFDRLHILTHAFWYNEQEKTARETILEFLNGAKRERFLSLAENIRDMEEFVQESEL